MQLEIAMNIEFEHMGLVVSLDNEYLVDVGNGQSCLEAMQLGVDHIANFENIDYRVGEFEDRFALFFRAEDADWIPRFSFTTTARELEQYAKMCHIIQTSPESHFTHKKVLTIARPDGRVTLVDRELEISQGGQLESRSLESNNDYIEALATYFNINLPSIPANW